MFNIHRLVISSLFVLSLFLTALAQKDRAPIETLPEPVAPVPVAPLVTATATAQRVRFVSPGTAVQLRLEVYNETGQKLFDTEFHGGNVLDWTLQDGSGQRLPAGAYACMLTIKSLSGRLSQRVGLVRVNDHEAAVEAAGAQLSTAQQQAISSGITSGVGSAAASGLVSGVGPMEGNTAFTVLQETAAAAAITAVSHDGQVGQVTSTAGPLSFRTGDLFSGKDLERLRITPEGNVGIGTDKPVATLDVAGAVRASEGFRFSDGTTLDATDGKITFRDAAGKTLPVPLAAGTGTTDRVAKWSETGGAGTLADSAITETGGQVGIGITNPGDLLDIAGAPNGSGRSGIHIRTTASTGNATVYFDNDRNNFAAYGGLLTGGSANPSTFFGLSRADKTFLIADGPSSLGMGIGTLVSKPVIFGTANAERMRIESSGNVGIGTTSPAHRLDVAGNINTSTQYNIGGNRVLSNPGTFNLFAGRDAGNSNTGIANSFFGATAGSSNTGGNSNSFFGFGAGNSNLSGDSNSFFGVNAGFSNTAGNNSFFGVNAGRANTSQIDNSYFGSDAGANAMGFRNSYFGARAGMDGVSGNDNSFFGSIAGQHNSGSSNSFFGAAAGQNNAGISNSFFGRDAGRNNAGNNNAFFGRSAGANNTSGHDNVFLGSDAGGNNIAGSNNTVIGAGASLLGIIDSSNFQTVIGAGAVSVRGSNAVTLGRSNDEVVVPGKTTLLGTLEVKAKSDFRKPVDFFDDVFLGVGFTGSGSELVCVDSALKISACSSSLRYKTDLVPFLSGLNLVERLQPISFTWKNGGTRDLGLGAEDVERVEPLLVTYNKSGQVEGVKYDRVAVVLLNAVKEQQSLISKQAQQLNQQQKASLEQRRKLDQQQQQLDTLRKLVCKKNARAKACR